jgi:hypothetical protein
MTGVGVGDLATAGFTGAHLGSAVLWAVIFGAFFKFILSEGLTKWQLVTNTSILHGCIKHLKFPFILFFLFYFFPWCFFVGGALVNACGVTLSALIYNFTDIQISKVYLGVLQSLIAVLIIHIGHYKIFSKIMSFCAIILFLSVLYCMCFLPLSFTKIISGIAIPTIPMLESDGLTWTIALMGGVGGTLTIICYGYWIAEEKRKGLSDLITCRIDLFVGYFLTALFGIFMVLIGETAVKGGNGLGLVLNISQYFDQNIGKGTGILFLLGAWGAVFSSLLGVWQCIPQIFSDCIHSLIGNHKPIHELLKTKSYYMFLWILASVPCILLVSSFKDVQKIYSLVGAFFMPILALSLLYLNNNKRLLGRQNCNSFLMNFLLVFIALFFIVTGYMAL